MFNERCNSIQRLSRGLADGPLRVSEGISKRIDGFAIASLPQRSQCSGRVCSNRPILLILKGFDERSDDALAGLPQLANCPCRGRADEHFRIFERHAERVDDDLVGLPKAPERFCRGLADGLVSLMEGIEERGDDLRGSLP